MNQINIVEMPSQEGQLDPLTELLRKGAQGLIQAAVEAELTEMMQKYAHLKTPENRAMAVRNGSHPERETQTGINTPGHQIHS